MILRKKKTLVPLKGILQKLYLAVENGHDIKAATKFLALFHAEKLCDLFISFLFVLFDRLRGNAEKVTASRLDLDKAIKLPLSGNDIRLSERRFEVSLQNFIAPLL